MDKALRFCDYLTDYVTDQRKLVGNGLAYNTWKTYKSRCNNFKEFLNKHQLLLIKPSEVTIRLIRQFDSFLRVDKHHCNDYVMRNCQLLQKMLELAIQDGQMEQNPMRFFQFKFDRKKKRIFLDVNQLTTIKKLPLPEGSDIERNRDMFLFGCYTGMSYCEIKNFSKQNIYKGQDGKDWIKIVRQKQKRTGGECILPLLPGALDILQKYSYQLPVSACTNMNLRLKKIAKLANIEMSLTTHAGRKSFGNILVNDFGVDLKTVSVMMGHDSITTTENWYVDVRPVKIIRDMRVVRNTDW